MLAPDQDSYESVDPLPERFLLSAWLRSVLYPMVLIIHRWGSPARLVPAKDSLLPAVCVVATALQDLVARALEPGWGSAFHPVNRWVRRGKFVPRMRPASDSIGLKRPE